MQLGLELRRMYRLAKSFDAYAKALNLAKTQSNQIITEEVREHGWHNFLLFFGRQRKWESLGSYDRRPSHATIHNNKAITGSRRVFIHLWQSKYLLKDVKQAYFRRGKSMLFPSEINPMCIGAKSLLIEMQYIKGSHEEALPSFFKSIVTQWFSGDPSSLCVY